MSLYPDNSTKEQTLTLRELNLRVKSAIQAQVSGMYWLRAETSDVRVNHASGHCYLEFVEKNKQTGQIVAKARASIWAKTFALLKPYFERETRQAFVSGLSVLVKVTVDFHELYGFSLTVYDIDPSYTLGDMARRRMEIVKQLNEEGIFTLNKELPFPAIPQRIAVITSPTAAGYEDFVNQLTNNKPGYPFQIKLFTALMQGEKTEESIISALDRIYGYADYFDVVAIIRGGGSTSDLNCFDSYLLAANCAQFPLPVITGIGHERDETVLDMVANTRMKTPTAVAEFLIGRMDLAAEAVEDLYQSLTTLVEKRLTEQKSLLQMLISRLPITVVNLLEKMRSQLLTLGGKLPTASILLVSTQKSILNDRFRQLQQLSYTQLEKNRKFLQLTEQFVTLASPEYILKRGYSLMLKEGKIVKSVSSFSEGETFIARLADGEVNAVVRFVTKKKNK
ncbi:MAG: exodeoxyribonuclease VII large subunit [Massilibacteroides sp.]|nr:exodeoxyribonuclease VII large subunit [Massilibacteroides sp.]MDD3062079.1 exodeoxyribonuclease VII large subunit [Massilibacteroides sp.]MDD4114097.1 exodeoxyribonuclease VII large subunit [Massilibacteroides sp.]MDD4659623.1 exodeoxyribonuclease VII large subunit [Massilibacteroides sp.]